MEKLTTDILLDILLRLPYETIINCKLVCKPWRDLTRNIKLGLLFQLGTNPASKFCYAVEQYDDIDMHGDYSYKPLVEIHNHRSIELEPSLVNIVGSCNGLVCFSTSAHDPIYICNPVTEEYVYLPAVSSDEAYRYRISCGFGYLNSLDEYKVVRLFNKRAQVYTLGSGHGWRDIRNSDQFLNKGPGISANGVLHWLNSGKTEIVAFDLADEEFRLIPLPPLSPKRIVSIFYLQLLGGHLCVVHIDVAKSDKFIHIWALQKKKNLGSYETKVHEFIDSLSWSKKFCFSCTKGVAYMPFAVTKSNQVLMSDGESVFCYDCSEIAIKKLWDESPRSGIQVLMAADESVFLYNRTEVAIREVLDEIPKRSLQAIPHMNSHVSLEALGEKSNRRT